MWYLAPLLLAVSAAALAVPSANETTDVFASKGNKSTPYWGDIVAGKLAQRQSLLPTEYLLPPNLVPDQSVSDVSNFPQDSGFFTKRELRITESTATEVIKKMSRGDWSAVEVLEATIKRSVVAQQLFNPLSEIMFDRGRATARRLDAYYKKYKKPMGPLHGLPMSMKDTFRFKGHDTTIGYVSLCNKPDEADSPTVTALENLGAVLYTKTNVVTSLMAGESINNIYNATKNPYNLALTPGGSSGGESALISFKGAFIGISTDIAGSIRTPAANTGLYGIRPSVGRCSTRDIRDGLTGQEAIPLTCGPMGRTVADIKLVMSSLVSQQLWEKDPVVLPIPWRTEQEKLPKKLSFAWANGDDAVRPWPPVQRAMHIARQKLEEQGHEVIEWVPPNWHKANSIIEQLFHADGHVTIRKDFDSSGEPFLPVIGSYLTYIPPEKRTTGYESWQLVHFRQNYSDLYRDTWLASANLTSTGRPFDALIMPSTSYPAKQRGTPFPYGYANLSPMLDLTSGAFPVTTVNSTIDVVNASFVPLSDADATNQALYDDPTKWENSPVGLQLIGQRLQEEKLLAMMDVVDKAINKRTGN